MNSLKRNMQNARRAYNAPRYRGDLAADIGLVAPRRMRLWPAALAALIAFGLLLSARRHAPTPDDTLLAVPAVSLPAQDAALPALSLDLSIPDLEMDWTFSPYSAEPSKEPSL